MSWGRPVVVVVSGVGVRFPGAETTVSVDGAVPLSAGSRYPAKEFLDANQNLDVVCWFGNALGRRQGNSLHDAVSAAVVEESCQ
jgi:hypothetical protein